MKIGLLRALQGSRSSCIPRLYFLLLTVALFVSHLSANAQGGRGGVTINVRVTSEATGANLDQVKLELVRFPDEIVQMAFTDSGGRASLASMDQGAYTIRASRAGFQPAQVEIDVRRGQTTYEAAVELMPEEAAVARPGGVISARQLSIPESAQNEFSKGVELLNEKKEPKQSIEHLRKAIDAYPGYYEAFFLLGMAELETNSPQEGQAALRKAIELNPQFFQPYYPLASLLVGQKRYEEAEQLLLQALALDKQDWRCPYELAFSYAKHGRWDKAIEYGQVAYQRPGAPSKIHLLMADLYSNTGNTSKAVAELEEFEKVDPHSSYIPRVQQVLSELRKQNSKSQQKAGPAPPGH